MHGKDLEIPLSGGGGGGGGGGGEGGGGGGGGGKRTTPAIRVMLREGETDP